MLLEKRKKNTTKVSIKVSTHTLCALLDEEIASFVASSASCLGLLDGLKGTEKRGKSELNNRRESTSDDRVKFLSLCLNGVLL